jgi:hypothetical protein
MVNLQLIKCKYSSIFHTKSCTEMSAVVNNVVECVGPVVRASACRSEDREIDSRRGRALCP